MTPLEQSVTPDAPCVCVVCECVPRDPERVLDPVTVRVTSSQCNVMVLIERTLLFRPKLAAAYF